MRIPPLLLISLLACPLAAQAADDDVDLSLPTQPMFTGEHAFGGGTYTGPRTDTSEYRRQHGDDIARRGGCPTGPDGSERTVTGSVSTGIGYSSRGGNSNWNAADINLCKETVSDAGSINTMQLNMRIARSEGPGYPGGYYGGGYGPYDGYGGAGGYFDGFGPSWRGIHDPYLDGRGSGRLRGGSWTEGRQPWR